MIADLFPWVKRNFRKWSYKEKEKMYYEAKKIMSILEPEIKTN